MPSTRSSSTRFSLDSKPSYKVRILPDRGRKREDHVLTRLFPEYNTIQCDKRNNYRRKIREEKKAQADPSAPEGENGTTEGAAAAGQTNGDAEPATKKIRRSEGDEGVAANGVDDDDDVDDTLDDTQNQEAEEDDNEEEEADEDEDEQQSESGSEGEGDLVEDPIEVGGPKHNADEDSDGEESD
jgi:DNA polymerase epsilon subunit 3